MNSTLTPPISLAAGATSAIDVDLIDPSPLNPRQDVDGDLAGSLIAVGQLDPILVRPHPTKPGRFELANGARRWKGAKASGGKVKALSARVRDLTDAQMLDVMLGTGGEGNVRPLTAMDEAIGYSSALVVMGLSERALAEHFGIKRTTMQERLALVNLPADGKAAVAKGVLPPTTAYLIARVNDPEKRAELTKTVLTSPGGVMSFAATKAHIFENVCRSLRGARFDQKDTELIEGVGACTECRFNTAHDRETYHDAPSGVCMSPSCFERKVAASRARVIAREEKAGKKILSAEENLAAFPVGESGLSYRCGLVELAKPPAADLLKKEVAVALVAGSRESQTIRVPTWRELCGFDETGRTLRQAKDATAIAQVWVGFDQAGRAVDLVKLEEALLAADENERAIFNAETIKRYHLDKGAVVQKAERGRKIPAGKIEPGSAPRIDDLDAPSARTEPVASHESDPWTTRAGNWIFRTLEAAPDLPPQLRAEGLQLRRELGEVAESDSTEDTQRLAEWQKAYALEMSPQKIAVTYRASLEDVCGALGLDVHVVRNEFSQLRQDAEEALSAAGLTAPVSRDGMVKLATSAATFDELTTPEQMRALLATLSRASAAKVQRTRPNPPDGD